MSRIKKWLSRPKYLLLIVLGIFILGAGVTIAYFSDTERAVNIVNMGKVTHDTVEEAIGSEKKNVGVKVTGRSECYVRIMVTIPKSEQLVDHITIKNANGQDIPVTTWYGYSKGAVLPSNNTGTWIYGGDGYWYFSEPLDKDDGEVYILSSIKYHDLPKDLNKEQLTIVVYSESVQTEHIVSDKTLTGLDKVMDAFAQVQNK